MTIKEVDKIIKEIHKESLGKWYVGRLDGKSEEVLKEAIRLVNEHTLYKKVEDSCHRGQYKYVLATEEILKQDYLGEPKNTYSRSGIYFHKDSWNDKVRCGIMEVNGYSYYDIRYALNNYAECIKEKEARLNDLNSKIREIKDDLQQLYANFPTLKQAITEWMEYEKEKI